MRADIDLKDICDAYENAGYPDDFSEKYTVMECLADRNGIDTFIVQDHEGRKYLAKCYDRSAWDVSANHDILTDLKHTGLPQYIDSFENENMYVSVREYVEGIPLSIYAKENELSVQEITDFCLQLCDILHFLHHREKPVIHRDIKPQNIIVKPDGKIVLIDFDIARLYQDEKDTDTRFFGTIAYAPPEQYGFSQTDSRTDIYSLGVLLRFLITDSTRENNKVKIYKPLAKVIRKCTAFDPDGRFSDVDQVKKALLNANPKAQFIRKGLITLCVAFAAALFVFAGVKIYQAITYTPFSADAIPAFLSDEERIKDAVEYMKQKYHTDLFDESDDLAKAGLLRTVLTEVYGLDRVYVYNINTEMPQESEDFFLPWGWDDDQNLSRDTVIYAAVKVHDPEIVADWSSLKDDNGFYPGVRVAVAFAEKTGITTGANRPLDITIGDMALIFANADRAFENAK